MVPLQLIISLIIAAILGVLVDWLLKSRLPERPANLAHLIATVVAIIVLAFAVVWISTSTTSLTATPAPTVAPTVTPMEAAKAVPSAVVSNLAFEPKRSNEMLIVIATFHRTEGTADTAIHKEIRRGIEEAKKELGMDNLRVELEPTSLPEEAQSEALELGKRYDADIVIWGEDTGVRVTVNFLDIITKYEARITETEQSQIGNPKGYAHYITTDLPAQLAFFSFIAVGKIYYLQMDYWGAVRTYREAIARLPQETPPPEGLAEAYFELSFLYRRAFGEKGALGVTVRYSEPIELNPGCLFAYIDQWNTYYYCSNCSTTDDMEQVIASYTKAMGSKLDASDLAVAYAYRGDAYCIAGNPGKAIEDYNKALKLDPNRVIVYVNRGNAYYNLGDPNRAVQDFGTYLERAPNAPNRPTVESLIRKVKQELEQ